MSPMDVSKFGDLAVKARLEDKQREQLHCKWPKEFADGFQYGATGKELGERLKGGYPVGFHFWPLERRNAWYAGFNQGYHDRKGKKGNDNVG